MMLFKKYNLMEKKKLPNAPLKIQNKMKPPFIHVFMIKISKAKMHFLWSMKKMK